jgi:hypothetical protein
MGTAKKCWYNETSLSQTSGEQFEVLTLQQ